MTSLHYLVTKLVGSLRAYDAVCKMDYAQAAPFWCSDVQWLIYEWIVHGNPEPERLQAAGYSFVLDWNLRPTICPDYVRQARQHWIFSLIQYHMAMEFKTYANEVQDQIDAVLGVRGLVGRLDAMLDITREELTITGLGMLANWLGLNQIPPTEIGAPQNRRVALDCLFAMLGDKVDLPKVRERLQGVSTL